MAWMNLENNYLARVDENGRKTGVSTTPTKRESALSVEVQSVTAVNRALIKGFMDEFHE